MSTTENYQAAERLLRRPARPGELIIGDKIRPQWIEGGARFWYAVSTEVGRRFVAVEPATGTREPVDVLSQVPRVGGQPGLADVLVGCLGRFQIGRERDLRVHHDVLAASQPDHHVGPHRRARALLRARRRHRDLLVEIAAGAHPRQLDHPA